jgi:thymidylate synthase (FAD)
MTVSFVHCTPDAEGLIVDMARVSNPANQGKPATAPRLISYLIKHKHWSPFEMAGLCLKIETERDISAQIIRHRSFSFQEFSTRYAATLIAECPAQRFQDPANRQNSLDAVDDVSQQYWSERTASVIADSWRLYDELLRNGMAKETARRILPLCTPTTMYMHGTLRSWIHYLEIRCGPETQLEHRQIAESCKAIFVAKFPAIATALNWTA